MTRYVVAPDICPVHTVDGSIVLNLKKITFSHKSPLSFSLVIFMA